MQWLLSVSQAGWLYEHKEESLLNGHNDIIFYHKPLGVVRPYILYDSLTLECIDANKILFHSRGVRKVLGSSLVSLTFWADLAISSYQSSGGCTLH